MSLIGRLADPTAARRLAECTNIGGALFRRCLARVRVIRPCRMSDIVGLHRLQAQRSKLISLAASRDFSSRPGSEDRKVFAPNPNIATGPRGRQCDECQFG